MCIASGKEKHPTLEAAYAELNQYIRSGSKDYSHVSPILYHTIRRNLDFYNFKRVEEWKAFKAFEVAFKATLFQIECGEELETPPKPETLLPKPKIDSSTSDEDNLKKGEELFKSLLSMFDDEEDKVLTPAEVADNERLERIK